MTESAAPRPPLPVTASVAALMAVATWLRLAAYTRGVTAEEASDLRHEAASRLLNDPELGVNPPLLKWLVNAPLDCWDSLWAGRDLSVVTSVLAIPVAAALVWRVSRGSALGTLAAAALLAVHPDSVRNGAEFRPYAPWLLTALVHLWSLEHAATRRWAWWTAMLTAVLLPQWHFVGVSWLALLGLGQLVAAPSRDTLKRVLGLYGPAALLVTPLLVVGLVHPALRAPHMGAVWGTLRHVLSLDMQMSSALSEPVVRGLGLDATWFSVVEQTEMAVVLVGLSVLVWAWPGPRTDDDRRVTWATVAIPLSVLVLGQLHLVRSPILVMMLAAWPALLFGVASRLPARGALAVRLVAIGVFALGIWNRHVRAWTVESADVPPAWVASWSTSPPPTDKPVHVYPGGTLAVVYLYATGHAWDRKDGGDRFQVDEDTEGFRWGGATLVELRRWSPDVHGYVVAVDKTPKGFAEGCREIEAGAARMWECP